MPGNRLVCLLPARNAADDLDGYFASVGRLCDTVVALDDGSDDGTRELLAANPLVKRLLTNPPRTSYQGWDDAANRNRLLEAAAELEPTWILSLDADERIDQDDAAALVDFLSNGARPGRAYGFRCIPMRKDLEHYRAGFLWVYRLFAYSPGQQFTERRLHLVPVPTSIPASAWIRTSLRIQHLGGLTERRRRARFEKYCQADPDGLYQSDYSNLLREPPGELARWEPRAAGTPIELDQAAPFECEGTGPERGLEPALSAIVIARDEPDLLERAVASVVGQQCPEPFEVIVVTSGEDSGAERIRRRFPEVTLVDLPRPALPGEARNAGLRLARGTYVSFPGSHVELPAGSLAARLRAHRLGYAMVTGVTLNGTLTAAGWASYFLDHSGNLPGQQANVLARPPAHCSYLRGALLEVGGFAEDLRAGEDTEVNTALGRLGYVAYRDSAVQIVHHSPCRTPWRLLTHHFTRGRGLGRVLRRDPIWRGHLTSRRFLSEYLFGYVPGRAGHTDRQIARGAWEWRRLYAGCRPLVVLGVLATWVGLWFELLRRGAERGLSVGTRYGQVPGLVAGDSGLPEPIGSRESPVTHIGGDVS